jgi:SMP-30/Gluconolactonase/LRE-like region
MTKRFVIRRAALLLTASVASFIASLIITAPVSPVSWTPPDDLLAADACKRAPTAIASVLAEGFPGSADGLAFDQNDRLLAAISDGSVIAVDQKTSRWTTISKGGTFLTGLTAQTDGTIYAVDEQVGGLYSARPGQALKPVLAAIGKERLLWSNDVASSPSGHVYMTTTATGRSLDDFFFEVLEHRGTGKLIEYDPRTGLARLMRRNLNMTNGIAVTTDNRLLVAESSVYGFQIMDMAGRTLSRHYGLPGFTGNIRASDRPGVFWITLLSPRSGLIDATSQQPWIRKLLSWLPSRVRPKPQTLPCLVEIALAQNGPVKLRALRLTGPFAVPSVSTAIERDGQLYLAPASIVAGSRGKILQAQLPPNW